MEDKKKLNEEELDKVSGGRLLDPDVIAVCSCGGQITRACEEHYNSTGDLMLECPNCGKWFWAGK